MILYKAILLDIFIKAVSKLCTKYKIHVYIFEIVLKSAEILKRISDFVVIDSNAQSFQREEF